MLDWNSFNTWHLVLPPSRPDHLQLNRISDALTNKNKNQPIAILGSTPEFRDLCHR